MPPKKYVAKDSIQKKEDDHSLTAVIVADSFDKRFTPLKGPWCLQHVCNVPIIDYTLDWILRTEIKKVVILVTEQNLEPLQGVERRWRLSFDSFLLVGCKNAMSVGDAVRDLDKRALLSTDFLFLANPASFTNSTLRTQIDRFRARRKENKNNVMTLIYAQADDPHNKVIGIKKETQQLAHFFKQDNPTQLDIDKPQFVNDVVVRRDIVDTGIALCSLNILAQFSDNFDFQQRDDIIREIMVNEEILLQNIHVDLLDAHEAGCQITDYDSFLYVSSLLIDRWLYPLCPGRMFQEDEFAFTALPNNTYVAVEKEQVGVQTTKTSINVLGGSSVFGVGCQLEEAVYVINSTIGDQTSIGGIGDDGLATQIIDCKIGAECVIGRGCVLKRCVLGDKVVIADGTKVLEEVIVSAEVSLKKLPPGGTSSLVEKARGGVLCPSEPDEDDEEAFKCERIHGADDLYVWHLADGRSMWSSAYRRPEVRRKLSGDSAGAAGDADEFSEEDEELDDGVEMEATATFYEEVLDNMKNTIETDGSDLRNLILEINYSKIAYNISMEDVAKFLFKAFLSLEPCQTFKGLKELAIKWKPVLNNYFGPHKNQIQMLMAIEERYEASPETFGPMVAKVVHSLYNDLDVLEEEPILEWNESLPATSPIRNLVKPIIDWLNASSEEESDEE